jgi:aminotransferase
MQRGVERALRELPDAFYADLRRDYERKRDRFCAALAAAGFRFTKPQGAYYVLADYRGVLGDLDPHAAALALIERIGINGVPGHLFHARPDGVRSIRFQFAVRDAVLDEVCARLGKL